MLFSSPRWLLAAWTAGQQTPLVSELGGRRVGHGGAFWSPWCCGSARFKVPVLGTNRDVSRRHLPVLPGRKTERPLSDEPEAAQEICGGAGAKPHISRSVLSLPGWGQWFNLTLSGCRGKVLPGLCQLLARAPAVAAGRVARCQQTEASLLREVDLESRDVPLDGCGSKVESRCVPLGCHICLASWPV